MTSLTTAGSMGQSAEACAGQVVRARGRIPVRVADGLPPRNQDPQQLVEVVAERLDDGPALAIGRPLDRLALGPTLGRELPVAHQASVDQPGLGRIELLV